MQACLSSGHSLWSKEGTEAEGGAGEINPTLARAHRQERLPTSLRVAQRARLLAEL